MIKFNEKIKYRDFLKIKKLLIWFIVNFYKILIYLNFYFLKTLNIKFTHNKSMGFGDAINYFFLNYRKIKKEKMKILNFSDITLTSSEFFFGKKHSLSILPKIYTVFYYYVMKSLREDVNPFPYSIMLPYSTKTIFDSCNLRYSFKRLVELKLSSREDDLLLKNYICIHIKHYNNDPTATKGSFPRQVHNLKKIELLINYLMSKNIKIVFLNCKTDTKSYPKLRNIQSKIKNNNMIFFANDIYPNFSLKNQCVLAINSLGYIGTDGGPSTLYMLLRKKTFVFDTFKSKTLFLLHQKFMKNYNFHMSFKKILYKEKSLIYSERLINFFEKKKIQNYLIKESSYLDLKKKIDCFFFQIL